MSDLLKKIAAVMDNPTEVINSDKKSPSIKKAVIGLAMVCAVVNPLSQAFAHESTAQHTHYEYAQIVGESQLVKDHIQNVEDYAGISIDQHSDYLNYKHPLHSRMNDFIKHAKDNYTESQFSEIEVLAEKAQSHYNNGHYENLDDKAHFLMPLTNESPIFLVDTTPEGTYSDNKVKSENLQATIDLFNKMSSDSSFGFDTQELDISEVDKTYHRVAMKNKADEKGFVISYLNDEVTSVVNNIGVAAWYSNDFNSDTQMFKDLTNDSSRGTPFKEAYNLTDYDIENLSQLGYSHEMGHLNIFEEVTNDKMNTGPEREFLAEVMSVWNDVKSGASEGFLEFRKDSNLAGGALRGNSAGSHDGYGSLKAFYDQFTHEEVKEMSLNEITKEIKGFVAAVPEDILDFGEFSRMVAIEAVEKEGIYPRAQEYFKKAGNEDMLDMLESTKDIPKSGITETFMSQHQILKSKDSSFFEKFMAENFVSSIGNMDKKTQDVNYEAKVEYASQLNEHLSSGLHADKIFEYKAGNVQTSYDKAETFAVIADGVKISVDGGLYKEKNAIISEHSDLTMETIVDVGKNKIIINVDDDSYNNLDIKIERNGDIEISMNGGDYEDIKSSHFDGFNSSYVAEYVEDFKKIAIEREWLSQNTLEQSQEFKSEPQLEQGQSFEMEMHIEKSHSFEMEPEKVSEDLDNKMDNDEMELENQLKEEIENTNKNNDSNQNKTKRKNGLGIS